VNMDHPKPVFSVPARTGMVSSTAAASENGVSLFHATVRIGADQSTVLLVSDAKLLTHHWNQPYRGAGTNVLLGLLTLGLFARQHKPEVQFPSEPVA
jgi:hypothetical protein